MFSLIYVIFIDFYLMQLYLEYKVISGREHHQIIFIIFHYTKYEICHPRKLSC